MDLSSAATQAGIDLESHLISSGHVSLRRQGQAQSMARVDYYSATVLYGNSIIPVPWVHSRGPGGARKKDACVGQVDSGGLNDG